MAFGVPGLFKRLLLCFLVVASWLVFVLLVVDRERKEEGARDSFWFSREANGKHPAIGTGHGHSCQPSGCQAEKKGGCYGKIDGTGK